MKGEIAPEDVPGLEEASDRLKNPGCAKAIGGGTVAWAEAGLAKERFFTTYLGAFTTGITVAQASGFRVELNTAVFFDPEHVILTGASENGVRLVPYNAVEGFAEQFGLDASRFTVQDFQAAILLHELGHTLGQLKPDGNDSLKSIENSQKVVDNCFKDLKK